MAACPPAFLDLAVTPEDLARLREELMSEIKRRIDQVYKPRTILRLKEVMRYTGYGRSSIYHKVADGDFPMPVDLGGGHGVGWYSDEIEDWINSRPRRGAAARDNGPKANKLEGAAPKAARPRETPSQSKRAAPARQQPAAPRHGPPLAGGRQPLSRDSSIPILNAQAAP